MNKFKVCIIKLTVGISKLTASSRAIINYQFSMFNKMKPTPVRNQEDGNTINNYQFSMFNKIMLIQVRD